MRIACRLFVTDVDRAAVVIHGSTNAERTHNAIVIMADARATRLFSVLSAFCEQCNKGAPPFADEYALSHVRGVIRSMIAHGDLSARHEQKMLDGVQFTPDGKTSGCVVSMFGEVL